MGFFSRLFGGDKPEPPLSPEDVEKLRAIASTVAAPAVHFVHSAGEAPSYFGGDPKLPPGTTWPRSPAGTQLTFLASVDLQSVSGVLALDWLPHTGRLLFFYDADGQQAWGFDPKDRGSWSVIYAEGDDAAGSPRPGKLPTRFVVPRRIDSLPSYERKEVESLALTESQSEKLIDLASDVYGDAPCHQMGGYPQPVQGDGMELECQLASNGIYVGEPAGYQDPRVAALEAGAADWRLLLQMDSDDALDVMWGDLGMIYFWIREDDARARRFERVWLILQCH